MRIKNLPSISSMDGSQDALIIEQTDGSEDKSRKVSPAQIKQYVLGNSIDDIYSVMGQNGAKNLIPYPYYETTKTTNGITFTDNGDGTITANGTATGTAQFGLVSRISSNYYLPNGAYTVTGCPNTSGCQIRVGRTVNNADSQYGQDTGNGLTFTRTDATNAMGIALQIASGTTVSNLTFKPMLRLATDTDDTYQPYAKTNKELTNDIDDVYKTMGEVGAKNLIPYPYTNAYRTTEGVTITEGSIKGSCVFNGTSTGRVDAQLGYRSSNALTLLPSVQYCLSIKTDGSFVGNLAVEAWNKGTTTYAKSIARVTPSSTGSDYKEVIFSVTQSDINNYDFAVLIYGNSGNTFNNVTVYPMLRLAADTDNTYQPYAMTNKQLTDEIQRILSRLEL